MIICNELAIAVIIILSLFNDQIYGQRNLTKDEILKYWNLSAEKRNNNSKQIVDSDSALDVKLIELVDSLQTNGIDSVLIFSTAYPGSISTSECYTGIFPITSFVIWNKEGLTHIRSLKGSCQSDFSKDCLHLFDIYSDNGPKLRSEFFMPIVLGGQMNKDQTISYFESFLYHEPNYSFYYKIGTDSNSFHFARSYLEDKEGLFWDYNLRLCAYHWWQQVKQETDKID